MCELPELPATTSYRPVRTLDLDAGSHPRGKAFLSAASGLVRVGERFYVVADDELHLGAFDQSDAPVRLIRLLEGDLPESAKKRKAKKPDLEALLFLPTGVHTASGHLLALGSGSRPNRHAGALLTLDASGEVVGAPRRIDLEPLYRALAARFEQLNIEGAFVAGDELVLLQRGNKGGPSASIRFALAPWLAWLHDSLADTPAPTAVQEHDLGHIDGVPFSFTDGAALPDGSWLFSAVAESTGDSYDDGACVAAAIGIASPSGRVGRLSVLQPSRKIEGIDARLANGVITVHMVTDADDPDTPAELGVTTLA